MITLDLETKSYADLKKVGAWAYSEDDTTDIICACWGYEAEPIEAWVPGDDLPKRLFALIEAGVPVEAHNVAFERSMWANVLTPRYGWPLPADDQWRDTMAVAAYYALPQALDRLARVLGFEGKDAEGGRLITRYSKLHLKTAKPEIPEDDLQKFIDYCKQDVRIEQSVSDFLGDLPERELPNFLLDQKINMRGLYLDREGIEAAERLVERRSNELTREFQKLTGLNPTQVSAVLKWLNDRGAELENMQAETLEELLENDLPQGEVRKAVELRLKVNKASTKKLAAMGRACGKDRRARWQTRYHGALTGRTTGAGFQPLNLNRGFDSDLDISPEQLVRDIGYGDPRFLDMVYGDAIDAVAKASRHWIMAAPGNRIVSGDFVSIEAVVLSCLAGEAWKIDAFRKGVKLYELMADKIYGLPEGTVTKATHPVERQDGKTGELAFGFQGALGAWRKFDGSDRHSDERVIEICKAWRAEHPMTVRYWHALEKAAIETVQTGHASGYRNIGFALVDEWLTMILPNGKRLWYWKPQLRAVMPHWHKPDEEEACRAGTCRCEPRLQITYGAMKAGQWKRVHTYGGKLTENSVQATSREILMPVARHVEAHGYHLILTVYDELVAEVPEDFGSRQEFTGLIMEAIDGLDWCRAWPINVDAWEGKRYRK